MKGHPATSRKPSLLQVVCVLQFFLLLYSFSSSSSNDSKQHDDRADTTQPHYYSNHNNPLERDEQSLPNRDEVSNRGNNDNKNLINRCKSGYPFVPCNATMDDMRYTIFDCAENEARTNRPLLNESERLMMQGLYHGIVGPQDSTVGGFPSFSRTGFHVTIEAKQDRRHGRSVWVTQPVSKGSLVWTSEGQTSCFQEGYLWRQFILSLPRYLVCDGMAFSYIAQKHVEEDRTVYDEDGRITVRKVKRKKTMVCTDLDEGAFMNSGEYQGSSSNVGCPKGFSKHDCDFGLKMFALRDIEAGEEILCNYDDIWVEGGWSSMGL